MVFCYWTQVNHLAFLHPSHSMFIQHSLQTQAELEKLSFLPVSLSVLCCLIYYFTKNTTLITTLYFQSKGCWVFIKLATPPRSPLGIQQFNSVWHSMSEIVGTPHSLEAHSPKTSSPLSNLPHLRCQLQSPRSHLCFLPTGYRPEAPMTVSLGLISFPEQLTELTDTVYLHLPVLDMTP